MNTTHNYEYQQTEQLIDLDFEANELGYESIVDLFEDEPELFDMLAAEWREGHS